MATTELTLTSPQERVTPISRRARLVDLAAIGIAAVTTLALVLPFYTRRPFWFDELVSIEIAGLSPGSVAEYVFSVEANMALYNVLLSAWLGV
ncbi:MAG: hypothetical protein ACRDQT_03620, partial [Gaiellaceae bacterium]